MESKKYKCLEDYVMYDGRTAFIEGKEYSFVENIGKSEIHDIHDMQGEKEFYRYFKEITETPIPEPTNESGGKMGGTNNWRIRFQNASNTDDGESGFFIEADIPNAEEHGHYPRTELMAEDFGDHNGYTREMRMNDALKIVSISQSQPTPPTLLNEWIYTKDRTPIGYQTGDWDGKKSDEVIAEDKNGTRYLAHIYEGVMDGSHFIEWYDDNGYNIDAEIVRWLHIPL